MHSPARSSYSFTQIIDADHFTIQRVAAKIRKLIGAHTVQRLGHQDELHVRVQETKDLLSHLKPLLLEATWRLIRHDLSEDIVMRPAFVSVLGEEGSRMAEHDRQDHADGRLKLAYILELIKNFESLCEGDLTDSQPAKQRVLHLEAGLQKVFADVTSTLDDLGKHMAIESGEFLPYFEKVVEQEMSWSLAEKYAATLIVNPLMTLPALLSDSPTEERKAVFSDEVAYIVTPLSELRPIYDNALSAVKNSDAEKSYVNSQIEAELKRLQVDKWVVASTGGIQGQSTKHRERNSGKL